MKKGLIFFSILVTLLCFQLNANAIPISVTKHDASTADVVVSASVSGTTITISETWISLGILFLEINGLDSSSSPRTNYTVIKEIKNNTGFGWTSFANELLDPAGDQNDTDRDPLPYPSFVPANYSTSNDKDGLSFAQGSGLSRTSSIFNKKIVDEKSDERDFIDFFGTTWINGVDGTITYGLSDTGPNQPFLLAQRPNEFSASEPVPEPATMLLVGSGLAGLLGFRRKFKKN